MNSGGHGVGQPPWWESQRVVLWASLAVAVIALLICFQQLAVDGALFGLDEYDDGVYLGGAIRLAHGAMPYRDFAFPHPPGIPLLYLPLALIGRIGSTRTLLAMARIITAFVAAGNVLLLARLLRRRGMVPACAAGLALAVFPLAVHANKTLLIEPYVVFFSLLGARLLLSGEPDANGDDGVASGRRLLIAGAVLGFAVAAKLWALLPIIGVLLACAHGWRGRRRPLLGGLLAGAVVPCLPFFFASPGGFVRQVFLVQLQRGEPLYSTSVIDRLVMTFGLRPLPETHLARTNAQVIVVVGLLLPLDRFALTAAAVSVVAVLLPAEYFPHYAYFTAAFLALAGGAALGAGLAAIGGRAWKSSRRPSRDRHSGTTGSGEGGGLLHWLAAAQVALLVLVGVAGWVGYQKGRSLVTRYSDAVTVGDFGPAIAAAIPAGACTLTDVPALTISAGRFVADGACPAMIDPFYEWLVRDPKRVPPTPGPHDPELIAEWKVWMDRADYFVLSGDAFRIPWDTELIDWFNARFRLVAEPGPKVFRNVRLLNA